jgi:2-polyprenyl-6-methoxyphenol hydroxylase-like FAD-dependent oxidoreductase
MAENRAMTTLQTPVLIAGGGPVGLTLAIDLGLRGIACTLIERKDAPAFLPKMERCNARTLEIFRRMGIADRVRAAGYPTAYPMDVYHIITMMDPPLACVPYPSVDEARAEGLKRNDGVLPLEPYQLISQYTLEPLLKQIAEENPLIDVRFGHELKSFEQDADGVTTYVRTTDGSEVAFRSSFLVGTDGGTSTVRKQLGFQMDGQANMRTMMQALYRCDSLYDVVPIGHGRHYKVSDEYASGVVCQDSCRHFSINAEGCTEADMPAIFANMVGTPIEFEMIAVSPWRHNLLCAQRYLDGRVMLAGDSAHLVIPTAGLGLNTGIGDAIDLSWKLAAILSGWGGPNLLQAYEDERRQIGVRNVGASGNATAARRERRESHWVPWIREDSERGRAFRERVAELALLEAHKTTIITGIERGYRYTNSSLIWPEPGEGPDPDNIDYVPTTWPGARLPHMWLKNGAALLDRFSPWYTVMRFGDSVDTSGIESALAAANIPYSKLDLDADEPAHEVYGGFGAFLIRPDLHVAWRGNATPRDPSAIVAVASGSLDGRSYRFYGTSTNLPPSVHTMTSSIEISVNS